MGIIKTHWCKFSNFVAVPNPKSPFVKTSGDRHYSAFLLRVEPPTCVFESEPYGTKIKRPFGRLIFVADGEGFEPPDGLPHQRFSRPSHSTALPTIQNFFRRVFKTGGFGNAQTYVCSYLASQSRPSLLPRVCQPS